MTFEVNDDDDSSGTSSLNCEDYYVSSATASTYSFTANKEASETTSGFGTWPNPDQPAGREFDKTHVHKLLTSPVYIGKVCYKTEVHEGEHDAIIDLDVYEKVQQILKGNATTCGLENRNKHKALLRGLLRCET
ncbi:recombinase family protein, partial [Rubripirellula sp.]|nr:recombinase family protein [Rubripirellula sp.]